LLKKVDMECCDDFDFFLRDVILGNMTSDGIEASLLVRENKWRKLRFQVDEFTFPRVSFDL
jgi:hypothetical protein